jgi:hypothetical protein
MTSKAEEQRGTQNAEEFEKRLSSLFMEGRPLVFLDNLLEVFENKEASVDLRMEALQVSRKYESAKVSQPVVRIQDNQDFIEKQRKEAILRRKMILVMKGIEPWNFPSDLKAKDWIPPTAEQMHSLSKKRSEPPEAALACFPPLRTILPN